jgi:putative phosphoribosyl transferase
MPDSYEALFHETGLPEFLLTLRNDAQLVAELRSGRLQRAIGVNYRPETERASHYFHARLADQFDAVIHIDETPARASRTACRRASERSSRDIPLRGLDSTMRRQMMSGPVQVLQTVSVKIPPVGLMGDLTIPHHATGVSLFAHGSGSSRFSSRNRFVAGVLQQRGFATLLLDLLTEAEEDVDIRTRELRFDIGLLAERLLHATHWLRGNSSTRELPVGYFGASTGGGAALVAAADESVEVSAVVSRGGRPDLAGEAALGKVKAPTLLIVGGDDSQVIDLNQKALAQLRCEKRLEIVPGATHLFEEPGTLEKVARLAADWFERHVST